MGLGGMPPIPLQAMISVALSLFAAEFPYRCGLVGLLTQPPSPSAAGTPAAFSTGEIDSFHETGLGHAVDSHIAHFQGILRPRRS